MSRSRWVATPSRLPGPLRASLCGSSVLLPLLLALCCFCWVPTVPVLYRAHSSWNVPLISPLVFPILLFSSISLHFSFKKGFLSHLASFWDSAFIGYVFPFLVSLLSSAIYKASSDYHFALLELFFLGMVLVTASCTVFQITIHFQALFLQDIIPWIYLSPQLCNHKGFDLGHPGMT